MYRIDSLHPDRLVCEACATASGDVTLDPGSVPLGTLPSVVAAAEWPELASAIRALEARCGLHPCSPVPLAKDLDDLRWPGHGRSRMGR
jgi:hypothetical protein